MNIMEQLAARIRAMKNPTVAGLDTRIEYLPESFVNEILPQGIHTFEDAAEAVYRYNVRLIDALCDIVPSVKVQVAYYEMYGPAGMVAYDKTIRYAKEKGMIVMADVKRNDIGATAACYANAYIGTTDMPDGAPFPRHGSVPPQLFLPGGALKGEGAPYGLPAALFSCGRPCSGKNPLWGKRTEKEFSFAVFPCREAGRLIAYVCFLFPSCRSQRKALSVPARSMSGPPEKSLSCTGNFARKKIQGRLCATHRQ